MHLDGYPTSTLPLLLASFQYRFARDLDAMTRHLVDDVAIGWQELGTDLLDGAPPYIVEYLAGDERWPSSTMDHLITPDGSPPVRMAVTEKDAADQDLEWGYVLRPEGIEVISVPYADAGPVVGWDTYLLTGFSDNPEYWLVPAQSPLATPARTAGPAPAAPATAPVPSHPAARH
ncbi:hypothetical protein AB0E62_35445 [Streptomyces sp. NPDC038707]|uniref:hypothetical protein n=1 Tax=Streptomyces sp. NPDC038707 TaxID=3154329 RepID=UPI0033F9592C